MNQIGTPENMQLVDRIILNGIVADCATGDENDYTIGVKTVQNVKTLRGDIIQTSNNGFPLTKEMEDRICWSNTYASIQMLTGDTPIDLDHVDDTKIISMMGEVEHKYYHCYSDYTGYLWTTEGFKCGGHDVRAILESHRGEYIHMEIELYKNRR